ncbi:glutamate-5-semialdehyde dehydrogenase [Roseimicrobium gellanilyticum]|uniref:Gamma-glutamyl phosphate reductase n=1 Tax=Roseimicrobium gellanilyticum TaxID=748857 RepID=A0A366HV80_9BACT|nr:glutamate-5-semialdehyde dehydrogenase [Roseimicrobium gellanilyticum]RBP47599.1 glutamate-5-semialdehyde dehydrogenase [Roseimicrobium gellanilyticum]
MTSQEIQNRILDMGARARAASRELVKLTSEQKNDVLRAMAAEVRRREKTILEANAKDIAAAEEKGLSKPMVQRLELSPKSLEAIAVAIEQVADLPDPVGEVLGEWTRPNGLKFRKERVPIGVIGIIYESRPNVTSDAAVLCFKTGNATILRGGSEAIHSNTALAEALQKGGERAGLPADSIQLIPFTNRESVTHLAQMDQYLDLIIPRGGKGLIERVVKEARMPVIKHYDGVCHVYVHKDASFEMAADLIINGKVQKPSACNAVETVLVHESIAEGFAATLADLIRPHGVEVRADATLQKFWPGSKEATEEDWNTEYLDLILSAKTVKGVDEAIAHINAHGSRHTDTIVTETESVAKQFMHEVDSAVVLWNASTRFNDGGEFGFGAEIGISTDKLHARGPMGLAELCSYKYLVIGTGQVRV